ncbi:MAG: Ig-like domain-containing protein, partial [Chloroflexi bacterium]|nr:Ig-like domain-containing protein [Chloroflexota bacterium]
APADVTVILAKADPSVVELPESLVIHRASYMVMTEWKALKPGKASMVAQANGLEAGNAQVEISESAEDATPVYLEAYTMLPSLPALTRNEETVLIQALNAERRPVPFPCVDVFLTSSSPRVVSVASAASSPCDSPSPYVTYSVRTTSTPGDATLTAGAAGLIPATLKVTTHGLRESRIELQYSPSVPTAVDSSPAIVSVQLVDDDGNPVLYHKDYKVTLLGSGVDISNEVIIPSGESFALVPIGREFISDEARISAVASGVEGMSIAFVVGSGVLEVSLDVVTLTDGSGTEVTARVTSGGVPVASAEVIWDAEGLLSQSRFALTDDDGIAQTTLSPQTTLAPIAVTVQASFPGYDTAVATTTKSPAIPGGADGGPSRLPFLLMFAGALAALIGYVVYSSGLYKKRPRLVRLRGFSKS